jgi:adenine-specific DNA-methyltransferase
MTTPAAITALISDADSRRKSATAALNQESRSDLGQFLTPAPVAKLMAGMFTELPNTVRLLDAGAGVGGLTASFVAEACARGSIRAISATAFEVEDVLAPHLHETFRNCKETCAKGGIEFVGHVHHEDFLDAAVRGLEGTLFSSPIGRFNAAIMNPPYRKIGTASRERRLVQRVGLDATNLYAAFVALAVRLLDPDGQLVAIIPRSFCNGPYFRPFRDTLLGETALLRIHVFASRKDAFRDDNVLQENVIIHVRKSTRKPRKVVVSSSSGAADGSIAERTLPYGDVVRTANGDQFIHLPTDADDDRTARWMATLPETLKSIGLTVSTGRVVDFRAKEFLRLSPGEATVPLIYPCHFSDGTIRWPKLDARKPNAIEDCAETQNLLVPRGYYVVTKRFSSKEERRRLVAAVYDPDVLKASRVGFENHLNYFHRGGEGLSREEAFGLCAFLNSEPIDGYFRQFNGHTQVNATDLRSLRYPSLQVLRELGKLKLVPGTPELEAAVRERYPLE